jgi:hypothetical protein
VPSGSGGTYHVYCQLVQRNLAKYIPGKPKTLIQNRPGSGGAKSASYMANVAPKDGSGIAMIATGTITTPLVRKVKFDAHKFVWLCAPAARASAIWVCNGHGIKTFNDAQTKQVAIATSGFSSAGSVFPRFANALLSSKFKLIYIYKGGGAMNRSVEKGEVLNPGTGIKTNGSSHEGPFFVGSPLSSTSGLSSSSSPLSAFGFPARDTQNPAPGSARGRQRSTVLAFIASTKSLPIG